MTNSDPALTHRHPARQRTAAGRRPGVSGRAGPSWAEDPNPEIRIERRVPAGWQEPSPSEPEHGSEYASYQGQHEAPAPFTTGRDDGGYLEEVFAGQEYASPQHYADEHFQEANFRQDGYPQNEYPNDAPSWSDQRQRKSPTPSRAARTLADFERARRHTRIVTLLKIGLPISGALALLAIVGVFLFSGGSLPSVEIGNTRIEDGKLVMDNPHLNGVDANQRPYKLTARRAIQDAANPSMITLEEISANLPMAADSFATVTAGTGLYDVEGKKLNLSGKVAVDTADGMTVRLEDADVNIDTGTLRTDNGVDVDIGRARVTADTLSIEDKGDLIVFENRVRMTLRPAEGEDGGQGGSLFAPAPPVTGTVNDAAGGQTGTENR